MLGEVVAHVGRSGGSCREKWWLLQGEVMSDVGRSGGSCCKKW
jgi:hypothetical protein